MAPPSDEPRRRPRPAPPQHQNANGQHGGGAPAAAAAAAGPPPYANGAAANGGGIPAPAAGNPHAPPQPQHQPPGQRPEDYKTPAHTTARNAAKMSEAEYMALHQHPSPAFIAENLKQRMDAVQQFALNAAAREQLEAHLRRQNEASGGTHRSGGGSGSSGSTAGGNRTPKQLEFPIIPASLIFRGSTDTRQVSDWVREWDQLSLYVSPTFKVAHLLTAIAEPVKQTLNAAFRTTRYNGGLGYTSLTHVPFSEIILLMKEVYDRPDHIYKAILRWRDLRMQNENLEGFLRARDKMNNQLSAYGVMVDAQTSKYMLVGAVSDMIAFGCGVWCLCVCVSAGCLLLYFWSSTLPARPTPKPCDFTTKTRAFAIVSIWLV